MRTIGEEPVAWRYRRTKPVVAGYWRLTDNAATADAAREKGYQVQPLYQGPEPVPERYRYYDPADLTEDAELRDYWEKRRAAEAAE